jgi:hypothetical protein
MKILDFLYFCGSFLPSWIQILIQQLKLMRIHEDPELDPDPDPNPAFLCPLACYQVQQLIHTPSMFLWTFVYLPKKHDTFQNVHMTLLKSPPRKCFAQKPIFLG